MRAPHVPSAQVRGATLAAALALPGAAGAQDAVLGLLGLGGRASLSQALDAAEAACVAPMAAGRAPEPSGDLVTDPARQAAMSAAARVGADQPFYETRWSNVVLVGPLLRDFCVVLMSDLHRTEGGFLDREVEEWAATLLDEHAALDMVMTGQDGAAFLTRADEAMSVRFLPAGPEVPGPSGLLVFETKAEGHGYDCLRMAQEADGEPGTCPPPEPN